MADTASTPPAPPKVVADAVGTSLYERAKRIIPGGTGLLSKRPELYLPDQWPAYYASAAGCRVTDLSGNEYVDMLMTPGCFVLGAADPDVNAAVMAAVAAGSFSSLNAPEEVELAELLVSLHPWAKECGAMVRYARGGGEICMMAVRIARAHTKRDRVAICGYHGWTDWYLAGNLEGTSDPGGDGNGDFHEEGGGSGARPRRDVLGKHWLADVAPTGVPSQLAGTTLDWDYGDVGSLRQVLEAHRGEVAAVTMEVARDGPPPPGFLEAVRALCDEHGAVLIFDEVSAAFREQCGGRHLAFGVDPDICTFSKTLSNGFAMAALLGRPEVMRSAQDTFISTTYHTERIGPAAALATLRKFVACDVQSVICRRGAALKRGWTTAAAGAGLPIVVGGWDAWPSFSWGSLAAGGAKDALLLTTLFTQEMLNRGYLANTVVAVSYAHTDEVLHEYLRHVGEVFAQIAAWISSCGGGTSGVRSCERFLRGPVRHGGFQRV